MGLLDRISRRGEPRRAVVLLGGTAVEVKGEASYQDALFAICGGKCEEGHHKRVTAHLVPEPDNKYDPNAVKVLVDRRLVGYLSRANAAAYRDAMRLLLASRSVGICEATIRGGWDRGAGDEGSFGIWLDLAEPQELTRQMQSMSS